MDRSAARVELLNLGGGGRDGAGRRPDRLPRSQQLLSLSVRAHRTSHLFRSETNVLIRRVLEDPSLEAAYRSKLEGAIAWTASLTPSLEEAYMVTEDPTKIPSSKNQVNAVRNVIAARKRLQD